MCIDLRCAVIVSIVVQRRIDVLAGAAAAAGVLRYEAHDLAEREQHRKTDAGATSISSMRVVCVQMGVETSVTEEQLRCKKYEPN